MWRLHTIIGLAFAVVGIAVPAMAGGFLSVGDDLPLAPGLTEVAGSAVTFDTPAGRIVEVDAAEAAPPDFSTARAAILEFYGQTLPQMGWSRDNGGHYRRDGEMLTILVKRTGRSRLAVHFTLLPD